METLGSFEAKTHPSRLLDRVARGEEFMITKYGKPVARLVTPSRLQACPDVQAAVDAMLRFREGRTLGGQGIREMIEESRRFRSGSQPGFHEIVCIEWIGDDRLGFRGRNRRVRRGDSETHA